GARCDLVQRCQRHLRGRRLHGLQKAWCHGGLDRIAAPRLPGPGRVWGVRLVALIEWRKAVGHIADRQAAATAPAPHDALPEGGSFARSPTAIFRAPRSGLVKLLLVVPELLPRDGAGMGVEQDDRSLVTRDLTRAACDPRRFPRPHLRARHGPTVDIGPGIE